MGSLSLVQCERLFFDRNSAGVIPPEAWELAEDAQHPRPKPWVRILTRLQSQRDEALSLVELTVA